MRSPGLIGLLALLLVARVGAASLDEAMELMKANKAAEARDLLRQVLEAEPNNSRAYYQLTLATLRLGGERAMDDALPLAEKAAQLAPQDSGTLTLYGQVAMGYAAKHVSFSAAGKGREALDTAVRLNPDNLDARQTLYEYYMQAPWPLGSTSKAMAHLEEIRKRDPARAGVITLFTKVAKKQYADAQQLCDEMLAKNPNDGIALFHYGRIAAISGLNLERGIERLRQFIALTPRPPGSPSLGNAWGRIGNIEEKLGHAAEAREAYETVLKLEPHNSGAAEALARVKQPAG